MEALAFWEVLKPLERSHRQEGRIMELCEKEQGCR